MSIGDALENLVTVIENQQMIRDRAAVALGHLESAPDASDPARKTRDLLRSIGGCASEASDFALKTMREIIQES
jgi:hypothetical protein